MWMWGYWTKMWGVKHATHRAKPLSYLAKAEKKNGRKNNPPTLGKNKSFPNEIERQKCVQLAAILRYVTTRKGKSSNQPNHSSHPLSGIYFYLLRP